MKKIGLLTLYNSNNYGAMLQAYALQEAIEKNGCVCQIIQHDRFGYTLKNSKNSSKNKILKIVKYVYISITHPIAAVDRILNTDKATPLSQNDKDCEIFRNNYFHHLSPHFYSNYKSIVEDPPECDGMVCGSDQIWNPSRFEGAAPFFLDFGSDMITRIAYAPSLASKSIPDELHPQYQKWLNKFDFVSVREKSGVKAIKEATGIEAECVLDPTFLIDSKEWSELAVTDSDRKGKFIFCYFLGKENFIAASGAIKRLAKKMNAKVVILPPGRHSLPSKYIAENIKCGPRSFLGYIRDAEYVVTDSFHGTAFSINFEKQFSVFRARKNTSAYKKFVRIEELLEACGLTDRIFTIHQDCTNYLIDYNIDIKANLNKMIENSNRFLSNALNYVKEVTNINRKINLAIEEECTGCTACMAVCKSGAISMKRNDAGFWHPYIDNDKCVKCGLCANTCPVLSGGGIGQI